MLMIRMAVAAALLPWLVCASYSAARETFVIDEGIALISRWPVGTSSRMGEDRVTAELYRPQASGRLPAAVIINSSGGITAHTELHYARMLAQHGIAALVIDSFAPRGVRRTGSDQNLVPQSKSNADAVAGFRWLASQSFVDPTRIIVLGMSRGGEAAYSVALEGLRKRLAADDIRFAAHIAITTGSCNFQQRDVRTTGAPIFFMLAELDDGTPLMPCIEYLERIRAAGNPNTRFAVYPGVYHAFEGTIGIRMASDDWTARACAGRYFRDENNFLYHRDTGKRATRGDQTEYLFRDCLQRGHSVGGDERVKQQAVADLLQFLRDVDVLHDAEARATTPDCTRLPDPALARNCWRARAGWTGDMVALARGLRIQAGVADEAHAARLFELAASRHDSAAQWELALMLRQGRVLSPDLARALNLARASAEAGDPAGINVYGVMIRDGIGRKGDDREAVGWFRRSAQLRNSYAMTNLGRFYWAGRGGLEQNRAIAVKLWRRAIYQDDNPWALLFLADALEQGQGIERNPSEARELFRKAASQEREPEARRRALEALSRQKQNTE